MLVGVRPLHSGFLAIFVFTGQISEGWLSQLWWCFALGLQEFTLLKGTASRVPGN